MEKARYPFRNPEYYFGWLSDSLDPSPYIALDYASLEQRMRAFTLYLKNVPRAIAQITGQPRNADATHLVTTGYRRVWWLCRLFS